jgi:hypothetical protein
MLEREATGMIALEGDVFDPRGPGPHRTQWRWQRVGRWGLWVVVLAGAAGLMGPGPLCDASLALGDGAYVRYPRFARANATQELRLHLPGRPGAVRLWLGREMLGGVQLTGLAPTPAGQEVDPDGAVYRFTVGPGGGEVLLTYRPRRQGLLEVKLQVGETPPAAFTQLVWP